MKSSANIARLLFAVLAVGATAQAAPDAQRLAIVVGAQSPPRVVSDGDLRQLYLKRRTVWPDNTRAIPVNLPAVDSARERFSRLILGRSVRELITYWDAQYFGGVSPPIVIRSPEAVCRFLAAEPRAVAYVPADKVGELCRVIRTLN